MWFINNTVAPDTTVTAEQRIDPEQIRGILKQNGPQIKLFFSACVHCTYCADTCFLQRNHEDDPSYMPSYKVIHTVGKLYRKKGRVSRAELMEIRDILWNQCALCTRCVCPLHLNIPGMIALGRDICRSQGVMPDFGGRVQAVNGPLDLTKAAS